MSVEASLYRVDFSFVVLGPPVPCARARVVARGSGYQAITPRTTREYEEAVGWAALAQRPRGWPLDRQYKVELVVFRKAARADVDNFTKSVLDGLNGVAWKDDRQVMEIHARMVDRDPRPRLEVTVSLLPAGAA